MIIKSYFFEKEGGFFFVENLWIVIFFGYRYGRE